MSLQNLKWRTTIQFGCIWKLTSRPGLLEA